tara:strand:+ start:226 stop:1407 length:1182 start_codon:yes stop_codon:yes gene_type:complete
MTLDFRGLISQDLKKHTTSIIENDDDEIITFYISDKIGTQSTKHYTINNSGNQEILSDIYFVGKKHTDAKKKFIRNTFKYIDNLIDIDFKELFDDDGSEIDIYNIESSTTFNSNVAGQAITQKTIIGSWTDIFWKEIGDQKLDSTEDDNTIIHEIGHALGLSHPFNDPFNKSWSTDDTVMSYNKGLYNWNSSYTNNDLNALISLWGRENDNGQITLPETKSSYKYKKENGNFYIKTNLGYEDITHIKKILFTDGVINVKNDIKNIFDSLTKIDSITGKVYRLYNSAFGRFPDYEGYNYWIESNNSNQIDFARTTQSFIDSEEYKRIYGQEITNQSFINTLYTNVLNRAADDEGFQYWIGQLNNFVDSRSDVLIGFSESNENKLIFSQETGIEI